MTAGQTIDYDALAQEAMRGLVRNVLKRTEKSGLPGDHHFYISFDTCASGVSLSKRLKEKYPREMTIVLQHRFWDLFVNDERFEVKLTFDGIPERLVVPFAAIKVFFDPSVRYGLQFEDPDALSESEIPDIGLRTESRVPRPTAVKKSRGARKSRADRDGSELTEAPANGRSSGLAAAKTGSGASPTTAANGAQSKGVGAPADPEKIGATAEATEKSTIPSGAQILKLDQFRKK